MSVDGRELYGKSEHYNETTVYDRKPNSRKNFILGVIINENLKWNCVDYITITC